MAPIRAKRLRRLSILVPALLASSACLSVPDLGERPQPRSAETLATGIAAPVTPPAGGWPDAGWWRNYGDAQLSALIEAGLAGSPTMDQAAARVRRADAAAQQAGARTLPEISASAQGGISQQSTSTIDLPPGIELPHRWSDGGQASLSFSFDLDLWGRNRATLRAAFSEAEAARADAAQARLTLSTAIASSYADLARLASVRATSETYLRIRGDTLRVIQARERQGLENRAAVMRAESGRAAAAAELAAIDEQIDLTRNAIAALVGEGPALGQGIALPAAARLAAFGLPPDLGIGIVGRRPDIVAARLRAEAQSQRIRAARADFYPNIRISALIGLQALGIGNLLDGGSSYGSAGPAVSLPIFAGGRIEGGYRGARADYDSAIAGYNQTLIDAVRDVADIAARQRALTSRLAESRASLAASDAAFRMLDARYRGGLATYLEVLSAEDSLNASRRAVAELEASAFILDVALVRALGGGFLQPPAQGTLS
ncbi:MAG TPA: efflux transporter outer membrane subunit [Allosphingosinicella sp.]|nr:efflux transporter outer membrane subunit [Allosphingosinicella sp.]